MTHIFDDQVVIPALKSQLDLFLPEKEQVGCYYKAPAIELDTYDAIIVCMSGGKDSIACLLHILDMGAPRSKIELWHHDVDGREGSSLMDWSFMRSFNMALAETFNLPIYFSWLEGGFETEMLKENEFSRPHHIETPEGHVCLPRNTKSMKRSTRKRFPQMAASLKTRWCSSVLKIDVSRRALTNQSRFDDKSVLFITGERREESGNRAKYNQLEPHTCNAPLGKAKRSVTAWRPVLDWNEEQVWDALRRHLVLPPVPYRLGWSRSSCQTCIFNSDRIWATIARYFPEKAAQIDAYERQFGLTICRSKRSILERAQSSQPLEISDLHALEQAASKEYFLPVLATSSNEWRLPQGAFAKIGCGSL